MYLTPQRWNPANKARATNFPLAGHARRRRSLRGLGDVVDVSTDPYPAADTTAVLQPTVVPTALENILTQTQAPQDPLSYVSPQAAIAAGLDSQTVYAAWTQAMGQFSTQQAAINAGVAPGIVTQLWNASRAYVTTPTSWLSETTFGVPNSILLFGGVGIFLLSMGRGKR
jgi:hypothetical protein